MSISIQLPPDVEVRLQAIVANTGRNETFHITEAILDYLEDMEDYFDAEQQMEELKAGKTQLIPIEEIMKEYGMVN